MNDAGSSFNANLQRGVLLKEQRRYKEASDFLQRAIEIDPEQAVAYAELALCWNGWGGREQKALNAIDRAIALEPTNARYIGLKGWILVCQNRFHQALEVANRGVVLDPLNITALNAQANAYTKLGLWRPAQASARRILEVSVNDVPALNLLAQALRFEGRIKESKEVVTRLLSMVPNNAFAQMNAGYAALEVGDHVRANAHFMVSLQLDPHCDLARKGLLYSLRSRVWIYRIQMQLIGLLRGSGTALQLSLLLGLFGILLGLGVVLDACAPDCGPLVIYLVPLLVLICVMSKVTGDLFLCFDPMGRHALKSREKILPFSLGLFFICLMGLSIVCEFWILLGGMVVYLGLVGYSISYPHLQERWSRSRYT